MSQLAVPLVAVLTLDASAAEMGYLGAVALLPNLLFALHAGAWADRWGRRRHTMIAADLGRAALLASVPLAYVLGALTFAHLYVVAFLAGALSVLFNVSDASLFQTIVARERFVEASSLLNGSRAFSFVAGPTVAGILVHAVTAPGALVVDAFSFLSSGALLGRIRPDERRPTRTHAEGVTVGLRWIAASPIVRPPCSRRRRSTSSTSSSGRSSCSMRPHARRRGGHARAGARRRGGRWARRIGDRGARDPEDRRRPDARRRVYAVPRADPPRAPRAGVRDGGARCLFLAEFGSGLGVMLLDISAGSLFAAVIPPRLRSRVSGAYTFVNYGIRVLGSLAGGLLGAWLGLRTALWIGAAGAMLGVLFLLPSPVPGLRELPEAAE